MTHESRPGSAGVPGGSALVGRSLLVRAILLIALLTALIRFPGQLSAVVEMMPILRLWSDPHAQQRAQLDEVPYDLLRRANRLLPANASVLLVTPGRDIRGREYRTYNRALYFLAPRSVWWLAPAPPDGTWESRWWISAPLTAASVREVAAETGASCVILHRVSLAQPLGRQLTEGPDGTLVQIAGGPDSDCSSPSSTSAPAEYAAGAWPLRAAAALALVVVLGALGVSACLWLGLSVTIAEALTLSWVVGTGVASLGMASLSLAGVPLGGQVAVLSLVGAAAAVPVWRSGVWHAVVRRDSQQLRRRAVIRRDGPRLRGRALAWLLIVVLAAQIVIVVVVAVGRPLWGWDSWATWGIKSRTIFLEGSITPTLFADPSRGPTLLGYPLLFPLVEAWLYAWLGAPDDRLVGLIAVLFYLGLIAVFHAAVCRRGIEPRVALAATTALATTPLVVGLSAMVFADIPLALLMLIGTVYFVEWVEGGAPGTLAIAAIASGLMPWTKREGLALLAAIVAAVIVAGWKSRRAWIGGAALVGSAALLSGPWWFVVATNRVQFLDFQPVGPTAFWSNLSRLPTIARLELTSFASPDWNFLWPLAAIFALVHWRMLVRPSRATSRFAVALPLAVVFYISGTSLGYVFSTYAPYQQHVLTSFYRLLAQVLPLAVLWIACADGWSPAGGNPGVPATTTPSGSSAVGHRS